MSEMNLNILTALGITEEGLEYTADETLSRLEQYIIDCQDSMTTGEPMVEDAIYDELYSLLSRLSDGRSYVLDRVWGDSGGVSNSPLFEQHPMLSIRTVKSNNDALSLFQAVYECTDASVLQYFASLKENGHGVRISYEYGGLAEANTRGNSLDIGRNIYRHMSLLAPDVIDEFSEFPFVEIRGELVLPKQTFDTDPTLERFRTAFTAVSSLVADSATDESIQKLRFVAYNIFIDGYEFKTISEKYEKLQQVGFEVPEHKLYVCARGNELELLDEVLADFETDLDNYAYLSDGIVLSINDLDIFGELPLIKNSNAGNIALKFGHWSQDGYSAVIQEIVWENGKVKITPVALVESTLVSDGREVKRVPLYHPGNILHLEAYPGRRIHFRYGGEAGVIPCRSDGTLLSEDYVVDIIDKA